MTPSHEAYYELAEQWRLKGSESFVKLAEVWVTPEEAKVLSRLNWWMTTGDLAKKLNRDEEYVKTTLDKVARTGLVRRKEGYWNASANMGSPFPQMTPPGVSEEEFNKRPHYSEFFSDGTGSRRPLPRYDGSHTSRRKNSGNKPNNFTRTITRTA